MSDVVYLRSFGTGMTPDGVHIMGESAGGCFDMHKVEWQRSFLAKDGLRMMCWYRAPDAESARLALKQLDSEMSGVWPASVHDAPGPNAPTMAEANVLVERSWPEPVAFDDIQAIEDAGASCLENHRVKFVRTFFSLDRKHMVCLYQAPDAESVRVAQREAKMPVDQVWAFQLVEPRKNTAS